MASEYYGLKGKLVKKYQQILKNLGADIKVNGTWGKKTEQAFNKYRDQFLIEIGVKQAEPEKMPYQEATVQTRTDQERRAAAENAYGTLYDDQIEALARDARDRQTEREGEISALEADYQERMNGLTKQYEQQRKALANEALSRGLGRSSYVTDQISGSQQREISDSLALGADAAGKAQAIRAEISRIKGDASQSAARLLNEREKSILTAIEEYRKADRQAADEAARYNNQLLQQFREEQTQQNQFKDQLDSNLEIAQLKKKK